MSLKCPRLEESGVFSLLKMANDLSQSQNLSGYQNSMETFYTLVKKN